MRKFLIAISLLMILLAVSSCSADTLTLENEPAISNEVESESENLLDETSTEKKAPEYKIYAGETEEKDFRFSDMSKIDRHSSAVDSYTLVIDGKSYTVPFYRTYKNTENASDKVKQFTQYNSYMDVKTGYRVDINVETGEVEFFSDGNKEIENAEGTLGEEEAKEKVVSIITELYGAEIFDEYEYALIIPSTDSNSGKQKGYGVLYRRYVHGFEAENDDIYVSINMNGELKNIDARHKGMLANAEKDITKAQIENAVKAYQEQYASSGWNVTDTPTIVVDSEGDYYAKFVISKEIDGYMHIQEMFINII